MSFSYKIYGLTIDSSRQVKILTERTGNIPDLFVHWTTNPSETPNDELMWNPVSTNGLKYKQRISFFSAGTSEGTFFKMCFDTESGGLSFLLGPDKKKLWLIYSEDELETNLDSYFVGAILGCVLRLRGVLCLHASVVSINNKAVIFLGRKKSGKSTTAAAFAKLGYKVLSDDIAAITIKNNSFYIEPGYPKIRLRPKSLAMIHPEKHTERFVSVFSHRDSRYTNVEDSFCEEALPLGAIYLLGETVEPDAIPYVESVSAKRLVHLHENTFADYIITPDLRKQEFEQLSGLSLRIPIRRLQFGRQVEMVNLQCSAVLEDLHQQTVSAI